MEDKETDKSFYRQWKYTVNSEMFEKSTFPYSYFESHLFLMMYNHLTQYDTKFQLILTSLGGSNNSGFTIIPIRIKYEYEMIYN